MGCISAYENLKLYPQTANGNNLKIEESRLVDKVFGIPAVNWKFHHELKSKHKNVLVVLGLIASVKGLG